VNEGKSKLKNTKYSSSFVLRQKDENGGLHQSSADLLRFWVDNGTLSVLLKTSVILPVMPLLFVSLRKIHPTENQQLANTRVIIKA